MKRPYQYEIENDGERFDFKSNFMSDTETGRSWLAEDAAENFYDEHDGWEVSWPLEFSIYEGDTFLGCFSVDVEYRPHFHASLVTA